MFHIVLYQPEIPPNTGNIIRLSANTGSTLHLIEPLGFSLSARTLKRAGLDYKEKVDYYRYPDLNTALTALNPKQTQCVYLCTTKASQYYTQPNYQPGDIFVFGPESRGLPDHILQISLKTQIKIPMTPAGRSLNLATAVSVIIYEAWRQHDFI